MSHYEKKTLLVYGGKGALGNTVIAHFKSNNWRVISISKWKNIGSKENMEHDSKECQEACHLIRDNDDRKNNINKLADLNLLVHNEKDIALQQSDIVNLLKEEFDPQNLKQLDGIICTAGGYTGGTLTEDFPEKCEKMWKQNVWPSIITASLAKMFLKDTGFVCLSGASGALKEIPYAIGYGMSKAAVHNLTKSLAASIKPLVVAILPVTLDTIMNRQSMPESDISAWTPMKYIVEMLYKWSVGENRPPNGTLVQFVTQNFSTEIHYLQ